MGAKINMPISVANLSNSSQNQERFYSFVKKLKAFEKRALAVVAGATLLDPVPGDEILIGGLALIIGGLISYCYQETITPPEEETTEEADDDTGDDDDTTPEETTTVTIEDRDILVNGEKSNPA